jgi:hypothetical protein
MLEMLAGDGLAAWPKGNETHGFFPFGILFFPFVGPAPGFF